MEPYLDPPLSADEASRRDAADRVTPALVAEGYAVRPARLRPQPYSKIVGLAVDDFRGAKLTYRLEAGGAHVRMLFYELVAPPASLRSSFAGFVAFLDWLATRPVGVSRLLGAIHELESPFGRALATERISRYYKRVLCGRTLGWEHGQEVIYTEMSWWRQFRGIRSFHESTPQ